MFGLPSFSKLALLALAIAVVWFGFRWIGQLQRQRQEQLRARKAGGKGVDTVHCAVCDSYIAGDAPKGCGRAGCPY
jgi:uncharacterized protein